MILVILILCIIITIKLDNSEVNVIESYVFNNKNDDKLTIKYPNYEIILY